MVILPLISFYPKGKKAIGVEMRDGTKHYADVVLSGIHPRSLFFDLTPSIESVNSEFADRMKRYSSGSGTLRINVALSELPRFTCLPNEPLIHQSSILFSPSIKYIEEAYRDAQTIGYARRPVIEMMTPSAYDDTLAPPGKHVASLFCQHVDRDACRDADRKKEAVQAVIETVDRMAPNFASSIIGSPLALAPSDLEQRFGLVNGDIFHGHLSLAQIWMARPVIGWGGYVTPITRMYQCGSGSHPGGGVTGYPGRNAAMKVIEDVSS